MTRGSVMKLLACQRGDATGAVALAAHAVSLDPEWAALRAAAEPFIRSARR